jgi:glycosidase
MTRSLACSLLLACAFFFACSEAKNGAADGEDPVTGLPDGGNGPDDGDEPVAGFVVHYFSAWPQTYVHYDDGEGWTEAPGVAMTDEGDGWFVHEQEEAEGPFAFTFNDGLGAWDNNDTQNYETTRRELWIKDGKITKTRPSSPDDPNDDAGVDGGDAGPLPPFCADVACGPGTCNEQDRRCDCDQGAIYNPTSKTCVADRCAGVMCGAGELCDPANGACMAACTPDKVVGEFRFCVRSTLSSYAAVVTYTGKATIDPKASQLRLNERDLTATELSFDAQSQTFSVQASGLEPAKYSYLFRLKTNTGESIRPLFLPTWIGEGIRYAGFSWYDSIMYQIMTDRFKNGDPRNDLDNQMGTLAQVADVRSRWQGGDFRGVIDKIKDGYFTDMGINTLWISSPLLNSHNAQPALKLADNSKFSSYHSYHPIVTGYTHLDHLGYASPVESAFGTEAELHELVREAHLRGIRVVPDFVANHVQSESALYMQHPDWFFAYNACDNNWDAHRIDCWFTTATPDFNYDQPEAVKKVVDHALWMIQEYNFDGFRADALKHMSDAFVRGLKKAIVEEVETTVENHGSSEEATVFYLVGESLGGWARYHVREDMVQGQVDEGFYNQAKSALLRYEQPLRNLANFAVPNDIAYLTPAPVFGGSGGYAGAVMGNFFGNHDQIRALTEAGGKHERLRLAQIFLMTSPRNVPMLYQGDDIGTLGGEDPDNRAMHRFEGLNQTEKDSLETVRKAGRLREQHPALRRGKRESVTVEDFFWVYKLTHETDVVYVVLNRDTQKSYAPPAGYADGLGHCTGGIVPAETGCIFVKP